MKRVQAFITVVSLFLALLTTAGSATTILDLGGGWEAKVSEGFSQYASVIPELVLDDAIVIQIDKAFTSSTFEFGLGQPIYIEFAVKNNAITHVPNIIIRDENITNQTDHTWWDFHMAVSWNIGQDPYVGFHPDYLFEPSIPLFNPFAVVEFDPNPALNNGLALNGQPTPTRINFREGSVASGETWNPGQNGTNQNYVKIITNMTPGDSFKLKEWPTVPEPGMLVLLSLGAILSLRRQKIR